MLIAGLSFVIGLQIGLREGRLEMPKGAYGNLHHELPAKTRQEIVSRWYQ